MIYLKGMKLQRFLHIFLLASAAVLLSSCSTTKVLQDGEYRLAKNKVTIVNDKNFNASSLENYIQQKPNSYFIFGWNPFLNIYNWSNGKGKGWDKFVQKIGTAPVVYDPDKVDDSIESINRHLEYLGYYNSHTESKISVKKKKVKVTYEVTLGERKPISGIEIVLPKRGEFPEAFSSDMKNISVKPGDYLSEALLEKETARSAAVMRNMGFYDFSKNNYFFEADTLQDPSKAYLKLTINEYTRNENADVASEPIRRFYFNEVKIAYPKNLKFREKVLKELNTIMPGDVYSEDAVNMTYERLSNLRIFNSVNIGMTKVDSNLVDCRIDLSQSKIQGFKVNLEASINSSGLFGISPQLSYYHKNIFRGGELLNLSFMGNFQFKFNDKNIRSNEFGVSASLSFPKFFPLPYRFFNAQIPRTDVNLSYNYQSRPEYTRNLISASFGYNGSVKSRFFYQAYPLQMNIVKLFNLDPEFYQKLSGDPFLRNAYQNHFDLGCGTTFYYTDNPDNNTRKSSFYTRFQFDIAGNLLRAFHKFMDKDEFGAGMIWDTPFSQFVRGELTLVKSWSWGKNNGQSLAVRLLGGAGYAYGNSKALPFEKHFYSGGANSLRGWQSRTVGPGLSAMDNSFRIPNQTGDMKLEANIEYRFDLFWKIGGEIFVDAGNVWNIKYDKTEGADNSGVISAKNFAKGIAADWGVGIHLDLGFLLLRVDWGFRLHDPARGDNAWLRPREWFSRNGNAVHFGVGYPF